jgi:LPS-assembly protein
MKNNKSLERRVDMNNIYNINRLGMDNSYEGGESITVGFDFTKEKIITKGNIKETSDYLELKLATIFRKDIEKKIPINSTLDKKKSNIFGQLYYRPIKNILLNYDFAINNDLNEFHYNSINTKINYEKFSTQFNFLEEVGIISKSNIIENISSYNFNDENTLSFGTRKNRNLNLTEYYKLLYQYKNDCLIAGVEYKKNFYNDADIRPVEELFFTITIVPLTTFSPDKMVLN